MSRKIDEELLIDNMIDFVADAISEIHKSDEDGLNAINDNIEPIKDILEEHIEKLVKVNEWTQEDLIELSSVCILLAASMGVPEMIRVDDSTDDNKDEVE